MLALILIMIMLMAWIVNWIWVFKVWPDGVDRLKFILATDLARALALTQWQGVSPDMVTGSANVMYGAVFEMTGIHDMGMRFAEGAALSIPDTIVRKTYIGNREAIEVAMVGTQLLGVRLATIFLVVPAILLLYVVAAADGLTQRAIRRTCGGMESASIYHRAKHLQLVLIAMSGALCLLLPVAIDPRFVWWPAAVAAAILTRMQWAFYKKHL
jgi:integrating conjugative element membrane protein (TIGR03747 family)